MRRGAASLQHEARCNIATAFPNEDFSCVRTLPWVTLSCTRCPSVCGFMQASVSMSGGGLPDRQGTSYSFDGTTSPDAAADAGGMRQGGARAEGTAAYATAAHGGRGDRLRRKGMRWDRDLPLYTTAGPIAPSSARWTELKLRQTLQVRADGSSGRFGRF